jgi:mannosyltransferase
MKYKKPLLILVLVVAALLRFYQLGAIGLWHDEAFSALLVQYNWGEMIHRIGLDVHPPIYYIILKIWTAIFGNTVFILRAFSATFGILTVWMVYKLVKQAFKNETVAFIAALLMAVNPFQIQYVTEARMYTLGAFFVVSSAYFLLKAIESQNQYFELSGEASHSQFPTPSNPALASTKKVWTWWILFGIATSLSLYTHYYLFFSAFGIGIYALIAIFRSPVGKKVVGYKFMLASYILALVSYLPWLKIFLFQFNQVQDSYWIEKMNAWSLPQTIWRMLVGTATDYHNPDTQKALIVVCLIALYVLYRAIRKTIQFEKWLIVLGLVIPFIGSALLSLKQSIFLDRYFLFAGIFYTIIVAMFLATLNNKTLKYVLTISIVGLGLFNYSKNWREMDIARHPGMAGAAKLLNSQVRPDDKIIVASSFEFFNFRYYNNTRVPALLYTPGINDVHEMPHFSGTALLNNEDLIRSYTEGTHSGQTIWVIWTNGFGGTKPSVPDKWVLIEDEKMFPDVHPYMGTNIYVNRYRQN